MTPEPAARGLPSKGNGSLLAAVGVVGFLAMSGLVAVPAIDGRTPFYTRGEPREALVVQTVFRGEGFILPMRNGDELPSKPPLFHWLGAAASRVQGYVSEGTIRAPGLVAALVTVAATAAAASAWWGPSTALLTAVVLATSFQWTASSVSARVDMILAATVTLALLLFARAAETGRRIPVIAYALVAAATLTKGPVGLVLPVAIALVTLALRGELRFLGWRDARLLAGATAVAGLWYAAALLVGGEAFFTKQIVRENVFRVLDADAVEVGHVAPFWYYLPLLAAGLAPWSLFLPGLIAGAVSPPRAEPSAPPGFADETAIGADQALDRQVVLALVWAVLPFLLFSVAGSKRAVYLLPAYPAYAMLIALGWNRAAQSEGVGPSTRLLQGGALVSAALLTLVGVVVLAGSSGLPVDQWLRGLVSDADANNVAPVVEAMREHRVVTLSSAASMLGGAWATLVAARRARWLRVVAATSLSMLALSAAVSTTLLPALASKRSPRAFLASVERVVPVTTPLSFYRAFDYGAVFYRQAPVPVRQALTEVPEIDGAWLLTWPAFLPDLSEEARRLDTGSGPAGTYEVEKVLPAGAGDLDPSDRTTLVLVRIVRRIGDERSDGN
jgi:4-amino-4-deoxy-L-arabinose transferase-like glycosyltransferase